MKKLLPLLAVSVVFAAGCGGGEKKEHYSVALRPLNHSGAEGTARLSLKGDELVVRMSASGLEPDWVHGVAIQGSEARASRCPSLTSDANGNDLVELREGQSAFGTTLLNLTPWPSADRDGDFHLFLAYKDIDRDRVAPLNGRVLLLEGKTAKLGRRLPVGYVPDLPVACGRIAKG